MLGEPRGCRLQRFKVMAADGKPTLRAVELAADGAGRRTQGATGLVAVLPSDDVVSVALERAHGTQRVGAPEGACLETLFEISGLSRYPFALLIWQGRGAAWVGHRTLRCVQLTALE